MMNCEVEKIFINKDNVLEIINQTLPIQEKHRRGQKVPCHQPISNKFE